MMKKPSFPGGIEGFFYVEITTPALYGGESILFVDEKGIAWLSRQDTDIPAIPYSIKVQ